MEGKWRKSFVSNESIEEIKKKMYLKYTLKLVEKISQKTWIAICDAKSDARKTLKSTRKEKYYIHYNSFCEIRWVSDTRKKKKIFFFCLPKFCLPWKPRFLILDSSLTWTQTTGKYSDHLESRPQSFFSQR